MLHLFLPSILLIQLAFFFFSFSVSGGGLGTQQAIGDRGCSGGSATSRRGSSQDPLHCSLSHWCLYLERQGCLSFDFPNLNWLNCRSLHGASFFLISLLFFSDWFRVCVFALWRVRDFLVPVYWVVEWNWIRSSCALMIVMLSSD